MRGAEELSRKYKARANIAPKQQKPALRLESEELDKYQDEMSKKLKSDLVKTKVKISQSRIEGKIFIFIKGKQEETSKVIKSVRDAVVGM